MDLPNIESNFADKLGVAFSWICLIHCIALPAVIPFLPFLSLFEDENFHIYIAILLLFAATAAFYRGYKIHKDKKIINYGLLGVFLITAGIFSDREFISIAYYKFTFESLLNVIGSIFLISAHLRNIRLCKCSLQKSDCSCKG